MWVPDGADFRAMQMAGLVAMALLIGMAAFVPRNRHRWRLGLVVVVLYVGLGVGILLYRLLAAG